MKTPENLEIILKTLPEIVKAAVAEKNKQRAEELMQKGEEMYLETQDFINNLVEDAGACAHLILEMLQEPLNAAGVDFKLPVVRGFNKSDMEIYLAEQIHKTVKIIPYNGNGAEK